ncbi:MAG: threonyl-tRNA synthetase editing domain-containing protein [Chloroflexia bacterium]
MKALLFLSSRFAYAPFAPTIPEAGPPPPPQEVQEAVVAFVHCEEEDIPKRASVFSRLLKQIKWLAGKRDFRNVVLHSFTHLAETKAPPDFARAFLEELAGRLQRNGYQVAVTPFGYTCSWELAVYGESLAKVFVSF